MGLSSNIRDVLTAFSPSLDFFAISAGDGRIKIWDTVKGQVQTEFVDIESTEPTALFSKPEGGHLSMDYTCMRWLVLDKKKKRKLGNSLLVLGTGSGDVLALEVSAGQLKWRVTDCHPGGVSSISFSSHCSAIYTAGADGMVCELDCMSGNLLSKFKASTKAISSMSVSSDGEMLATAAAQLKIFNCSNHKKLQKFSGHPGAARCMSFSEDGKYVLSSAASERYVAVWKIDGSKKQSASCFLAMDHPAVFLDSRPMDSGNEGDAGLSVLAISEMGVCYIWQGKNIDELHNSKPTKICISSDAVQHKGALPNIFAAKLQAVSNSASSHVFLAYGLIIKPSFEKFVVQVGSDLKLNSTHDGILLPINQSHRSKKAARTQYRVTALDRANAEGALLPVTSIFDMADEDSKAKPVVTKDEDNQVVLDVATFCMEDRLRSLGILTDGDNLASRSNLDSRLLKGISLETDLPHRKMRSTILSMNSVDAYNLLKVLMAAWQSRSHSGKHVLPWIRCILVNHSEYIVAQESMTQLLDSLQKLTKSKGAAINPLLQLSGRLQLVTAQIDRASTNISDTIVQEEQMDESEEEDDDEIDEVLYGVGEDSQSSSDNED